MQFIRLHIGCLLVILYIEITYIKATSKAKIPCNTLFYILMLLAPWAVFFDGLTAWTVNHTDIVPVFLNRLAHLLFLVLMDLSIIITALYMYDQLIGLSKNSRKRNLLIGIPGIISLILIVAGIGDLDFIIGKTSAYSMGFSVYQGPRR